MTSLQKYQKGALSPRGQRRQDRAAEIRRIQVETAVAEIDGQALVEAHRVVRDTQIGQVKITGVMDLAEHAASAWTSFTMKMDLQTQLSASALPGLSVIMQRTLIEIDEALDDCTHKITGRDQL